MKNSLVALALRLRTIRRLRQKMKRRPRSMHIRSIFLNRSIHGESILAKELRSDRYYHFRYFRMDKANFDEILAATDLKPLSKKHILPISWTDKLAITLRYLATGNSQISLAMSYRISPSSICKILREVMASICHHLGPIYLPNPSKEMWTTNELGFKEKWNFPNACGAIDGKHIRIQSPRFSGTTYFNYKNYFSVVLLAITDPSYKFSAVSIGHSGSQSDGGIFARSDFGKMLESPETGLPDPKNVDGKMLPHVILSDDAFSLKPNNMKPFPGKFLTKEKRVFNYRLSRGRMVVENSFGLLAARWRIFHTCIIGDLDLVKLIVKTAVILHNFLLSKNDLNTITIDSSPDERNGNWRQTTAGDNGMSNLRQQGSNNHTVNANQVREHFKDYFNGTGAVAWQDSRI